MDLVAIWLNDPKHVYNKHFGLVIANIAVMSASAIFFFAFIAALESDLEIMDTSIAFFDIRFSYFEISLSFGSIYTMLTVAFLIISIVKSLGTKNRINLNCKPELTLNQLKFLGKLDLADLILCVFQFILGIVGFIYFSIMLGCERYMIKEEYYDENYKPHYDNIPYYNAECSFDLGVGVSLFSMIFSIYELVIANKIYKGSKKGCLSRANELNEEASQLNNLNVA